jgi:putative ABC transport system permease protein
MRPSALLYIYRRRLRSHLPQELLAGLGIAIAVALVFAAVVSETSIAGSAGRVVDTVIGPASLQLRARGPEGIEEAALARVRSLPGVRAAAPLLEATATIRTRSGHQARVQLAGADVRLAVLDGLAEKLPIGALSAGGIGLTQTTARELRLPAGAANAHRAVTLELRGRSFALPVNAVLGPEAVGAMASAPVAVMQLAHMQRLAGLPGKVTRIFVQSAPGARAAVRRELSVLAGGRMEVAPADQDIVALRQALSPSDLASGLFAAIGALLGLLLAFNAMLLTIAERRRAIADLRVAGARRASIVELVIFEALCLGLPASLLGVLGGYLLSSGVFSHSTNYLSAAFTLSGATIVHGQAIVLALTGGVLATCTASALPLLDLRRSRARDAIYEQSGVPGRVLRIRLAAGALCLAVAASALWILSPSAAIAATALLAIATVLMVPLTFAGVLALTHALGERMQRLAILPLALASLRATPLRSLALAATGAVALFGSVALGGARQNLLDGIGSFDRGYVADADIWVGNPGDNQAVQPLAAGDLARRIARLPGVAGVQSFGGGFIQLGSRRVWVIARPPYAQRHVLATEIRGGSLAQALSGLARGAAIAISQQIASERGVRVGESLTLPTPSGPRTFKVIATTTNLAWPPGVIFMSSADYGRYWKASEPTALGVSLTGGASASAVRAEIERVLPPGSGLEVSLASSRAAKIDALAGAGLSQLQQVSTMLLIAAIVAMVAALGSTAWQRRAALAGLALCGARRASLQCILAIEALLMLGAGCLTGALAGLYGQVVIDAFLRHVTGFPLASPTASARPIELFALVLAVALALGAFPGWLASRVPPVVALAEE